MDSFVGSYSLIYGLAVNGISKKITIGNGFVDTSEVLIHHSASTQCHMPNFRVTHLPFGQAHGHSRGVNHCFGIVIPQLLPHRRIGVGDGVVLGIIAVAKAIKN